MLENDLLNGKIGIMLNARQRRITGSEKGFGDKCTLEPMFSCNGKSTTDNNESLTDGYDLLAKYRHVYAGTGNWLKVSNRITSYSYNYALDNNGYQSRKVISKLLENQRKTKSLGTNIKGDERYAKTRHLFGLKKIFNKTIIGEKCKEENDSQIGNERKAVKAGETTNKFSCAANSKHLPSHKSNRHKQNGEHKPAVKHISIDQTQKVSLRHSSNYALLPETLPNKAQTELENGNWLGCKIDHSQNNNKNAISRCSVIDDHHKDVKTINQKDKILSPSSDAIICENTLQVRGTSSLGISEDSKMKEGAAKTDGLQRSQMVTSTRKHMNLFSRLSQEAQAAMQEAINEMKDDEDDVDRKQTTRSIDRHNHQAKDTVKYSGISNTFPQTCSFVDLDQIENKQQIPRSISVDHFASAISENSSSCKAGTRRVKKCGSIPTGLLPSSAPRKQGTFVITPMGYDSRFRDRPVMLDVTDETPEEVKEHAFVKCRDWLIKHT